MVRSDHRHPTLTDNGMVRPAQPVPLPIGCKTAAPNISDEKVEDLSGDHPCARSQGFTGRGHWHLESGTAATRRSRLSPSGNW